MTTSCRHVGFCPIYVTMASCCKASMTLTTISLKSPNRHSCTDCPSIYSHHACNPLLSTCAQLDSDPLGCTTCEETEEDHDAVNMTVSENPEPNDIVNIEDVSRKTTIGEILNIVTKRIHYLGFPKMDLNMGLLHPTSQLPAAEDGDLSTSLPQDEPPHQVPFTPKLLGLA